jgi:hypothetical protein
LIAPARPQAWGRGCDDCIRRTEEDLVVTKDEIHETKKEGVKIGTLMISRKIIEKTGEGVQFFVRDRTSDDRMEKEE